METHDAKKSVCDVLAHMDTARCSQLHMRFAAAPGQEVSVLRHYAAPYLVVVVLSHVILHIVALTVLPSPWSPGDELKLPFLRDPNTALLSLVTLPVLVCLLLSERATLPLRTAEVVSPSTDEARVEEAQKLVHIWERRYGTANTVGQLLGIVAAIAASWLVYALIAGWPSGKPLGHWGHLGGHTNAAGWVLLLLPLPLLFWALTFYVFRAVTTVRFLDALVKGSWVEVDLFHHDSCGGLRPVGRIGLRNQVLVAAGGVNIVAVFYVLHTLGEGLLLHILVVVVGLIYVVCGPLVFLGPLLPFRRIMLAERTTRLSEVASRLRREYDRVMKSDPDHEGFRGGLDLVKELRELREYVSRMPVWPFDTSTLRKFLAAFSAPFAAALAALAAGILGNVLARTVGPAG